MLSYGIRNMWVLKSYVRPSYEQIACLAAVLQQPSVGYVSLASSKNRKKLNMLKILKGFGRSFHIGIGYSIY